MNISTKLFLVKNLSPVIIVLLIFFNIVAVPHAISQSSKTTIILYTEFNTKQFNERQVVTLKGQVIYHPPGGFPVGVTNVYYKIINQDTNQIIYDGYTDSGDGEFSYEWLAESYGKRTTNLQAIFPGSGGYEYAESNTLELEIFSQLKVTNYNTYLTLQVEPGSTAGSIQVYPQLTSDRGNDLSTDDVEIYVDGKHISRISSNQWSEISIDTGLHTIRAEIPQLTDNSDSSITYLSSSDEVSHTVSGGSGMETHYNTELILQIEDGSTTGTVQIYPQLTYSGNNLSTSDVEIYVDGIKKAVVSSNQWSEDIFTDTGSHTIRAEMPQLTDISNPLVFYESSSDEVSYTVSGSIQPPLPPTPPQPPPDDSSIAIVALVIVGAVGVGAGIALSKRKKKLPAMQTPYVKSSPTPIKPDDTQFWVCPHCGKDTELYYGKQYCRNCNVYL